MAKVKITGHASGTGILTVTAPNTSTDRTITLPDATGTLLNSDGSAASLTSIPAANITGTLPAIDGSNLTGISTPITALNSATADELVTVGSTTTELDAEAKLTFSDSGKAHLHIGNETAEDCFITFEGNGANYSIGIDDTDDFLKIYHGSVVEGGSPLALAITPDERILVGTNTSNTWWGGYQPNIQQEGNSDNTASIGMGAHINSSSGPALCMTKSRNTGWGGGFYDLVASGDILGLICWSGGDGTDRVSGAGYIRCRVDGTPGSNDMPGRIEFGTTADGASNPTERFRIAQNGDLTATDTSIGSNSDERLKENINDFTYDVSKFKQLRPRTFDWRNPTQHNNASGNRGFIAQEIQPIDDYWLSTIEVNEFDKHGLEEIRNPDYDLIPEGEKAYTSKLGKKDAMYISVINQLIERIEALENE